MSPESKDLYAKVADYLLEGQPQAYALRFDGSLVIINQQGQKFIYPPLEVQEALEEVSNLPPKAPKQPPAPKKTK